MRDKIETFGICYTSGNGPIGIIIIYTQINVDTGSGDPLSNIPDKNLTNGSTSYLRDTNEMRNIARARKATIASF